MSILKEGLARFYSQTWHDVRLQLHSSGKLAILHLSKVDVVTRSVDLGLLSIATPPLDNDYMIWGGSEQMFIVKQDRDSSKNLIFGVEQQQECRRWIEIINFVTLRKALDVKHIHPLTTVLGPSAYLRNITTRSVLQSTGRRMVCCACQNISREEAYQCEFCDDCVLCPACHKFFNELQSPFVTTPHHPFALVDPAKAGTRFKISGAKVKFTCSICSRDCGEDAYRCMECGTYAECRACVRPIQFNTNKSDMHLEPKFLAPVLTESNNTFALNTARLHRCPSAASLISNRPWDLSTIDDAPPNAYFEVTFHTFNHKEGKVSVGIGNQIFVQNQLLGHQQNSIGYYSDGFVSQNTAQKVRQFPSYQESDTLGVGILLDSFHQRKAFFTLNGQFIGTYSESVHVGMDCFPGVSFTKGSEVIFSVNLTGPFKFDLRNIPDYRKAKTSYFSALPHEIALHCLELAAMSARQTCNLRLVNKQFAKLALANDIWKRLYLSVFNNQNAKLKVKSWYTMYMRRQRVVKRQPLKQGIENCAMEFECPLMWEDLTVTDNHDQTRQCDKCYKTVYKVDNKKSLEEFIQMGRCVSLQLPTWTGLMGAFAAPNFSVPEIIPPPFQLEDLCGLPIDDNDF